MKVEKAENMTLSRINDDTLLPFVEISSEFSESKNARMIEMAREPSNVHITK